MSDSSFIDDVMGFDPSSMDAFNEPAQTSSYDQNIYKTRPADSKSEDGRYHSSVRVLYNPFNFNKSIVEQATYAMNDEEGFFMVRSKLANNDKTCPLFKAWKKLWFSNDEKKKEWAKDMFNKNQSRYALVQVIEDENQPEKVGKILAMKLPKAVWDKMTEKMHPTSGKAPQKLMDYLIGPVLTMNVVPGPADDPKRTSYNLCDFETDPTPIIKTDGSPLFTDEEIENIESYARALGDLQKAKTDAKKQAAQKMINDMVPAIKELYQRAIDYMKENALNLEDEVGYHPWTPEEEARVNRWIDRVLRMEDPRESTGDMFAPETPAPNASSPAKSDDMLENMLGSSGDEIGEDLPF